MTEAYRQGFIRKCAEYGLDGNILLKRAGILDKGLAIGRKILGNASGSRVAALEKRLADTHKGFWGKHFLPGEGGGAVMTPSTAELLPYTDRVAKLNHLLELARQAQFNTRLGLGVAGAGAAGYALS